MCLAIPGKVINTKGQKVTVQYPQERREVFAGGMSVVVGDWVLVQMGIVVKVLSEEEALESQKAWDY